VDHFVAPSIQRLTSEAVWLSYRQALLWYRIPAIAASLLLLLASLFGNASKHDGAPGRLRRGDLLYLLALAVFLLALRWPALAIGDLEGDESVTVSAALTRYLDPAFGVTLFTGSAGPLLSYPVSALGLLGFRIDFGASKLVSQLLLIASSGVLYLALRTFSEARIARIALFPLLAFVGLGSTRWTLSYCSEQWINLLVASMLLFLLRLDRKIGREGTNLFGIGISLGSIPLVKWQGLPMAALFVACAVAIVWSRWRRERAGLGRLAGRLLPLALPGGAPLLLWCAVVWGFGGLGFFFQTYFVALFTQATSRYSTTLLERLIAFPEWGIQPFAKLEWFLCAPALFWVPAAILLCLPGRPRRFRMELALAALYLVISLYAVLQPGGSFSHYLNLLVQPYAVLFMLIFCRLAQAAARPAFVGFLGLAVLPPAIFYLQDPPLPLRMPPARDRAESLDPLYTPSLPGSPMIQWGWVYGYFVSTGMTWGSRTGGSHEILEPFFPDKTIFIADYVASLESERAPVFIDTATEGSGVYDNRALYGHERYPEVADAVRRNYFPCAEFPGARIYLLRKRYQGRAEIAGWCASLTQWWPTIRVWSQEAFLRSLTWERAR
jgi:hypothetical protein